MKILRVQLHGFGAFNKGLEVKFAPDALNLVVGRNEAGKSTLMSAIVGVLFGFRDLNVVRKFEPWDEHDAYSGEIDVLTEDARVLRFSRDFKTQRASIAEVRDGLPETLFEGSADPRGARDEDQTWFEHLGRVLGIKDEAVFRSTVFFGQQGLQTAVSDQIRRLISGSTTVDYKGALHELHRRHAELTTENPWRTKVRGPRRLIEETQGALEEDRTRLDAGRRALFRTAELEDEIETLKSAVDRDETTLGAARASLELHERLESLLARRTEADRRWQEALHRRDSYQRYADRSGRIEERIQKEFGAYRNAPENLPDLVRGLAAAREEAAKDEGSLAVERRALQDLRKVPNAKNGLIFGLVLGGVVAAAMTLTPLAGIAGIVLGLVAFPFGWLVGQNVGTGYGERKAALEQKVRSLEQRLHAARKKAEEAVETAGPVLAGQEPEDVLRAHREWTELREERKRCLAAMKALGTRDQVEQGFADAVRDQGGVQTALDEILAGSPGTAIPADKAEAARAVAGLRVETQRLEAALGAARSRLEAARLELAGLGSRMDFDLAGLEEGVREKEQKVRSYDLERAALKEAIDTLDACIKDFQDGDVFRLSDEISRLFARITGEKYAKVALGTSLEPVISRGDRIAIAPEDLSQGAQDQLYFAMRVAMARHLCRDIRLPLFLDDPFVNFDADRLAVTRDVLQNLDDHQVIMVTCNRDYEAWTPTVIDLDAARAS